MKSNGIAMGMLGTVIKTFFVVILIVIIYRTSMMAYDFGFRIFAEEPMTAAPGRDVAVRIDEGSSALEIGEVLEKNGLIRDAKLFFLQELLSEYKDKLQPGTYTLNTAMTADQMMQVMAAAEQEEEE